MASLQNLSVYQGDDYGAIVTVKDGTGADADISTYTARAQIRRNYADLEPAVLIEIAVTVASPEINLAITHDQTRSLTGKAVWDLQLTSAEGIVTTLLYGAVTLRQEVTREVVLVRNGNDRAIYSGIR